jgi:hypothetical protein
VYHIHQLRYSLSDAEGIDANMTNSEPQRVKEQLPIPLFDGAVLAVRGADGRIFLSLRDICDLLELDLPGQRRRIRANNRLTLTAFVAVIQGEIRTADYLLLEDVPLWLLNVQLNRVSEQARIRVDYIQAYLVVSVQRAFGELISLPTLGEQPSSAIEDLRDLDRIDAAFQQLEQIANRQDRASLVVRDLITQMRDLRTRVQELEALAQTRISAEQRGTIFAMVQRWGEARAERTPNQARGVSIRRCWGELNSRFGVSTYTDLPATRYDEIVLFVKQQYAALTGQDIAATEQGRLEF